MSNWKKALRLHVSNSERPSTSLRESTAGDGSRPQPKPEPTPPLPRSAGLGWQGLVVLALLVASIWLWRANAESMLRPLVDYSTFYAWLEAEEVNAVRLNAPELQGDLRSPKLIYGRSVSNFRTVMPENDPALLPLLHQKKVVIRVSDESSPGLLEVVLAVVLWAVLIGVFMWTSRHARATATSSGALSGFSKSTSRCYEKSTSVKVTFDDLAGLASAKRDLQEVVLFLEEPERFRRLGGKVPRGVLLVGPPGTGKTLLARAVAGQSGVPFFSISASEFIELFVGVGAARVRDLFEQAKKCAPAIIFIDELDAVGARAGPASAVATMSASRR